MTSSEGPPILGDEEPKRSRVKEMLTKFDAFSVPIQLYFHKRHNRN